MVKNHVLMLITLALVLLVSVVGLVNAYSVDSRGYAYIDDANVRIEAPLIIGGVRPLMSGTITSKAYSGNINLAFGFNNDIFTPTGGWVTEYTTTEYGERCDTTIPNREYTISNGVVRCYDSYANGSAVTVFEFAYTRINAPTQTAYYEVTEQTVKSVGSITKRYDLTYNDKDTWYVLAGQHITPTTPLSYYFTGLVPVGGSAKYDIAFYPSGYGTDRAGIINAINDGVFYYLDPFINTTDYEVGNVTNTSNTWTADNGTGTTVEISTDGKTFTYGLVSGGLANAIAAFPFDNDTIIGGLPRDQSGNNEHFNAISASTGVAGIVADGLNFDGVSQDANGTDLDLTPPFSISAWIRPQALKAQIFMEKPNGANPDTWKNFLFTVDDGSGEVRFFAGNTAHAASYYCRLDGYGTKQWNVGDWSHVVVTVPASGTCALYVNNTQVDTDAISGTIETSNDQWTMGSYSGASLFYDGDIDEVYFYDRVLNTDEISTLWGGGTGYQPYSTTFNTSKNQYVSAAIPISQNISSFTTTWNVRGGSASVIVSCNGGASDHRVAINNTSQVCPVIGDSWQYEINLTGGDENTSPIMQNLTLRVSQTNDPPVVSGINFTPTTPNGSTDVIASTYFSDPVGHNGTVRWYWFVNGVNVVNDTNATPSYRVVWTNLSSAYYNASDNVTLFVNATDGTNTSNTINASFIVAADTPPTPSAGSEVVQRWMLVIFLVVLIGGTFLAYTNSGVGVIAGVVSFLTGFMLLGMIRSDLLTSFSGYYEVLTIMCVIFIALSMGGVLRGGRG